MGTRISLPDLDRALEPFARIRAAVGREMEIMVELHGLWTLPPALRIAEALRPYDVAWIEEPIRYNELDALAELARKTPIPIAASERLASRQAFRQLIARRAASVIMIDLAWCGGISEARKIANLAEAAELPVTLHDCTGPIVFAASCALSATLPNVNWQEAVRAYYTGWYREIVADLPAVSDGRVAPARRPRPRPPPPRRALHPPRRHRPPHRLTPFLFLPPETWRAVPGVRGRRAPRRRRRTRLRPRKFSRAPRARNGRNCGLRRPPRAPPRRTGAAPGARGGRVGARRALPRRRRPGPRPKHPLPQQRLCYYNGCSTPAQSGDAGEENRSGTDSTPPERAARGREPARQGGPAPPLRADGPAPPLRKRRADRLPQGRDARASCISTSARRRRRSASARICARDRLDHLDAPRPRPRARQGRPTRAR